MQMSLRGAEHPAKRPESAEGGVETTHVSRWVRCALSTFEKSLINLFTACRIRRKRSFLIWLRVRAGVGELDVDHVSTVLPGTVVSAGSAVSAGSTRSAGSAVQGSVCTASAGCAPPVRSPQL